ncbi:MAG: hypothetical protein ACI4WU_04715 [Bacilli bacterium]
MLKSKILKGILFIICMGAAGACTYTVKSNADEITLTDVKMDLEEKN